MKLPFFYIPEAEAHKAMPHLLGKDFTGYREFAKKWHGDQKRTGDIDYVSHLDHVAHMLYSYWVNDNKNFDFGISVRLAYLHDVLEDTACTLDDIEWHIINNDKKLTNLRHEGDRQIRNLLDSVQAITKDAEGSREDRLKAYNERLSESSVECQIVKCFDIISNVSSIAEHNPSFAKQYLEEKLDCLEAMKKLPCKLHDDYKAIIEHEMAKVKQPSPGRPT